MTDLANQLTAWFNLIFGLLVTLSMAGAYPRQDQERPPDRCRLDAAHPGIIMSAIGFAGVLGGGVST